MKRFRERSKLGLLAIALVATGGAAYWLWGAHESEQDAVAQRVPVAREARDAIPPSEEGRPAAVSSDAPVEDDLPGAPDPRVVRQQAEDNPHETPEALLDFAHGLAGLMDRALDSEAEAAPAFAKLERCANDPEGRQTIQARLICLANASRLAREFPEALGSRYRALESRNPRLVGMLQASGL